MCGCNYISTQPTLTVHPRSKNLEESLGRGDGDTTDNDSDDEDSPLTYTLVGMEGSDDVRPIISREAQQEGEKLIAEYAVLVNSQENYKKFKAVADFLKLHPNFDFEVKQIWYRMDFSFPGGPALREALIGERDYYPLPHFHRFAYRQL